MPFTLSHPAAIIPLARGPLVPSALVLGSMAPDLPYYVSLQWIGGDYNLTLTHTWTSLLWLDPLIGLVLLAGFHLVLKRPLLALLPAAAAGRVWPAARQARWWRPSAAVWVPVSLVLGAATHLAWDALDDVFGFAWSSRLNLASSVLGGLVLLVWLWRWWRAAHPESLPPGVLLVSWLRAAVIGVLAAVSLLTGLVGAVRVIPEVRESQTSLGLDDGLWTGAVLEAVARTFVIHAGTALGASVAVYAVAWHLSRLISRPADRRQDREAGRV